jgi:hypothetical protein
MKNESFVTIDLYYYTGKKALVFEPHFRGTRGKDLISLRAAFALLVDVNVLCVVNDGDEGDDGDDGDGDGDDDDDDDGRARLHARTAVVLACFPREDPENIRENDLMTASPAFSPFPEENPMARAVCYYAVEHHVRLSTASPGSG